VAVARQVETLGFESIWLFDHFHSLHEPSNEVTFESFTSLAALGAVTSRVRLGHVVICTAFRNPALTAKMISTMDVQTGGRMELGIGSGSNRDEHYAYGYGFPETRERLADHLEVISAMMAPGPATFHGEHASVEGAFNVPKPLQSPRVPIMVGGNGPNVTWRLAARHADELNVIFMTPAEIAAARPTVAARCEEIGRDPESLPISVFFDRDPMTNPGPERVELLAGYLDQGVSRVLTLIAASATDDEALEAFAADCREAGAELA
jgi:alkanesulfonate monooxygenase SsuD/methylene tetrahydromethanopterin reductase-like flavin-dependent oxidoreductase (luciferase family)